jgi:MADS-box transcription factor
MLRSSIAPSSRVKANCLYHSTFLKRKGGLFKKAHELSVLCSVDVAVIIFGNNKKLYEYSSSDIGEILQRYNFVSIDRRHL